MHFPIIEILENDFSAKSITLNHDDPVLNANVDYIWEEYPEAERKVAIELLGKCLEGIANVDIQKETITFLGYSRIEETLDDYVEKIIRDVSNITSRAGIKFWHLRELATRYKRDYSLFWINGVGYTSIEFVEHAIYHAGDTFKIGKIYDAHY